MDWGCCAKLPLPRLQCLGYGGLLCLAPVALRAGFPVQANCLWGAVGVRWIQLDTSRTLCRPTGSLTASCTRRLEEFCLAPAAQCSSQDLGTSFGLLYQLLAVALIARFFGCFLSIQVHMLACRSLLGDVLRC